MFAADSAAFWYLTRGTGLVAIVLLSVVVALGIAQVQRWAANGWPQFVVAGIHKNASLLVMVFLAVHIASAVFDGFAPIDWIAAIVPFESSYRPLWLGLGALSFDLLIAVVITSLLRPRLGYRTWRVVHWTTYACWPIAFLHGLGTGSDGTATWVLLINAGCLALVIAAVAWRIGTARGAQPSLRAAGGAVSALATMLIVLWTLTGPAQAGWARKAGTPPELLSAGAADPATSVPVIVGPTLPTPSTQAKDGSSFVAPFSAELTGTVDTKRVNRSTSKITIDGALDGEVSGRMHLEITGPASEGGIRMQSGRVTLGPSSDPSRYTGEVTSLRRSNLVATVHDAAGNTMTITADLQLDDDSASVRATVTATAGNTDEPGER